MCGIPYDSLAMVLEDESMSLASIGPIRIHARQRLSAITHSTSSSYDLTWLDQNKFEDNRTIEKNIQLNLSDFKYYAQLGDGYYTKVFCVQHIPSKEYVAIKIADGNEPEARIQIEVEKRILFKYSDQNPFMIKPYCAFSHGNYLCLVIQLIQGDTLYRKIQTRKMNEDEIRFIVAEIICIIQFLHRNNIVYRDLKLEHVIIADDGHIRLVDYGLVKILKDSTKKCFTHCGTHSYMAPEVRFVETETPKVGYSFAVDYWALGIMILEMFWGERYYADFQNTNSGQSLETENLSKMMGFPSDTSQDARQFVYGLLENDPEKRLGSANSPHGSIRHHKFFKAGQAINWQDVEDALQKPPTKHQILPINSTVHEHGVPRVPLSEQKNDGKKEWNLIAHAKCSETQTEDFKSFNRINESMWKEISP